MTKDEAVCVVMLKAAEGALRPERLVAKNVRGLRAPESASRAVRDYFSGLGFIVEDEGPLALTLRAPMALFERVFEPIERSDAGTFRTKTGKEELRLGELPAGIRDVVAGIAFSSVDFGPGQML